MAYYNVCPKCGSHLDPGEHCDCGDDGKDRAFDGMVKEGAAGQYMLQWLGGSGGRGIRKGWDKGWM